MCSAEGPWESVLEQDLPAIQSVLRMPEGIRSGFVTKIYPFLGMKAAMLVYKILLPIASSDMESDPTRCPLCDPEAIARR